RRSADAEQICCGFWPGHAEFPEPAFFAYTYPKPEGIERTTGWDTDLGEFALSYEEVRKSPSPRDKILQFFESTYAAGARLRGWHGQVTPVWPPTGIALVAILVLGWRVWPAVFAGALAVNLPLGPSPFGAALIATGNTLAPLVAAQLLMRVGFRLELDRLRDAAAI